MSYHQLSFQKYLINVIIVIFSLNVSFAKAQISFPEEYRQAGKLPQAKREVVLNNSNLSKPQERIFAPYYYLGNDAKYRPNYDLKAKYDEGVAKVFTLAFIVGRGGCNKADWDSEIGLEAPKEQINELRSSGGNIILSFGGNVSKKKQELAFYCRQPILLKAQYSKIIEMYQASRLDFDIEGLSLPQANDLKTDPVMADVDRRNRVLAELQHDRTEKGNQLQISFTLAVGQDGLKDESLWVIENAMRNKVKITRFNLMTMYFGQWFGQNSDKITSKSSRNSATFHNYGDFLSRLDSNLTWK